MASRVTEHKDDDGWSTVSTRKAKKAGKGRRALKIVADAFWRKFQFEGPDRTGPLITVPIKDVLAHINGLKLTATDLVAGYMATCKHLFIANPYSSLEVTPESVPVGPHLEPMIKTQMKCRVPGEAPVRMEFISREDAIKHNLLPECKFLDVVLYKCNDREEGDWKVVMLKAQPVDFELPMEVATAKRNASGEKGGSGTALSPSAMKNAETYWASNMKVI